MSEKCKTTCNSSLRRSGRPVVEVCGETVKRSVVVVVQRSTACGLWKIRKVGRRGEGKRRSWKAEGCLNFLFL